MERRLDDVQAAVTRDAHSNTTSLSPEERRHVVRQAGRIVREDIVSSVEFKNVRKGTDPAVDIQRELVPVTEYMPALPPSPRVMFHATFRWDM